MFTVNDKFPFHFTSNFEFVFFFRIIQNIFRLTITMCRVIVTHSAMRFISKQFFNYHKQIFPENKNENKNE